MRAGRSGADRIGRLSAADTLKTGSSFSTSVEPFRRTGARRASALAGDDPLRPLSLVCPLLETRHSKLSDFGLSDACSGLTAWASGTVWQPYRTSFAVCSFVF